MRELYRVIPYDPSAAPTKRGGALFVPAGSRRNRIDNPDLYDALYLAAAPEAAIAESFGRSPIWTSETFVHGNGRPYSLVTYRVRDDISIFDLDDVDALRSIGITRPSTVVTRDRAKTQAWARSIFESGRYSGAGWWSHHSPDWMVVGLWEHSAVSMATMPEILTPHSSAVREAAKTIVRQIDP
jgi:hypothetical protein